MTKDMTDLKQLIGTVAEGVPLDEVQAETAFDVIMSGDATPAQIGGFLMALRVRGESVPEIIGAARAMRGKMHAIDAPPDAIDTCGTGGDAKGTFNISTAAAFVVAACGVPVAKHGNRALSSKSGAADVLTALGVNIEAETELVSRALREAGTCFLMATRHHSAMRHVGPARVELGTRTIFNILGPLCNPARVKRQILGVFNQDWLMPLAEVLKGLGHEKAWVVHGEHGFDELTSAGLTHVVSLDSGHIEAFDIDPKDYGLRSAAPEELQGGDSEQNARALLAFLKGAPGALRDTILLTSAGALVVADKVETLSQGLEMAAEAVDSGRAALVLDRLVSITNTEPEQ